MCLVPPRTALSFCDISYPVYTLFPQQPDVRYWTQLDESARLLSEKHDTMKCTLATCKAYECALFFPKCDSNGEAPLDVCRKSCVDCLSTCTGEKVHPGVAWQCFGDLDLTDASKCTSRGAKPFHPHVLLTIFALCVPAMFILL